MEAGPAEPGPWHAWRRACLVIQLCSPQGRERGGGGFAGEGRCWLPQAGDRSGHLCPPLGIGCALTQKQAWGLPGERSPQSALLPVHTDCFLCPLLWPLALSSGFPSLLSPSTLGPYPCKHSLVLVWLNWEINASPKARWASWSRFLCQD